jgi:hypothetical protein
MTIIQANTRLTSARLDDLGFMSLMQVPKIEVSVNESSMVQFDILCCIAFFKMDHLFSLASPIPATPTRRQQYDFYHKFALSRALNNSRHYDSYRRE